MVLMTLSAGQQWRCRHREQTCGRGGGVERVYQWGEQHGNVYTTTCEIESQWECAQGAQIGACDKLEGWAGVGGGRDGQEGGDVCVPMADSC